MKYSSSAPPDSGVRQTNSSAALSAVVYHSRAISLLSGQDLQGLMQIAQARNRREAITGVLLYDEGHFFQWLEGPAEGVDRIMRSIRSDTRHADLEVLSQRPASGRSFIGWDMKLATRNMGNALWQGEVIEPSFEAVSDLRQDPHGAARHLLRLVERSSHSAPASNLSNCLSSLVPMAKTTAAVLRTVFLNRVVPQLLQQPSAFDDRPKPAALAAGAAELTELILSGDEAASLQLIRELRHDDAGLGDLHSPLFESAARHLGDLWAEDFCTEFDLTLGLIRLQMANRLLGIDARPLPHRSLQPNVLILPAPGESHHLVASLDAERLSQQGWAPQQGFPADDRALEDLVADAWVDVLDLSLSAAFQRSDRLPRLRKTISLARRASQNPALLIVVGGRVFAEHRSDGFDVGADLASRTSQGLERIMLAGLEEHTGSEAAQEFETAQ